MKRKLFALFLVLTLTICLLPASALAAPPQPRPEMPWYMSGVRNTRAVTLLNEIPAEPEEEAIAEDLVFADAEGEDVIHGSEGESAIGGTATEASSNGGILPQLNPHRVYPELIPQQPPGARGQILRRIPSAVAGAVYLDAELRRRHYVQLVPEGFAGDEKALQLMVAVRPPRAYGQQEIDFGRGLFPDHFTIFRASM